METVNSIEKDKKLEKVFLKLIKKREKEFDEKQKERLLKLYEEVLKELKL